MVEVQRYVLLIALAVTGYLLASAWQEDYGSGAQPSPAQEVASAPRLDDDVPEMAVVPEVQSPVESVVDDSADVPTAVPEDAIDAPTPVVETAGRLAPIRVETDLYQLWISPRGGDIVKLNLVEYPLSVETPDVPLTLLDSSAELTYVVQSGLIGPDGIDAAGRAVFTSGSDEYRLREGTDSLTVELRHVTKSGVVVDKTFTFNRGSYLIDVAYAIDNRTDAGFAANFFGQIKRDTSPAPGTDLGFMSAPTYLGGALMTNESPYEELEFDDIEEQPFQVDVTGGWVALVQHYFLTAWIPGADATYRYQSRKLSDGNFVFGFTAPRFDVAAGTAGAYSAQLYIGPKIQATLDEIAPNLSLTVDYGWLWWIAQPLFWVLQQMYDFSGNWGISILLLTLLIKILFFQLSAASYRSMANMRRVTPEITRIREQYGEDRQKMTEAMMELYKREKFNPLGGCLPMLPQMPVFIALYWVLLESVELRHAPFSWINDLSAMDPFFILPILMGVSMYLSTLMQPPAPDPMQQRMMQLMPVIFTVFFISFPAGLVLYWLANQILSVAQQFFIMRRVEAEQAAKT